MGEDQFKIPPRAALLVVGNEILSGKVRDENISFLAIQMFELGWTLGEVTVVGDIEADIVEHLRRLRQRFDFVFTSGGVGPTHDDITLQAVALATGRPLVSSPMLEKLIKRFYKTDVLTPAQRRLAMIPEGATLHYGPEAAYPQMVVDNVYPLPGIPDLFRRKFLELRSLWPQVEPPSRHCFKMIAMETDLAAVLGAIASEHESVSVGSYPTEQGGVWHLELVLESRDPEALQLCTQALRNVLKNREISWQETPPEP